MPGKGIVKMKMGFIFNQKFPYFKGKFYAVDLPGEVWKDRYLRYCDSLKVIGRKEEVTEDPSSRLGLSSIDKVSFECVDNVSHLRKVLYLNRSSKHVSQAIADCDFVICRGSWGVKECKKAGKPYLVEVVGCEWDALWNHSWPGKVAALPRFLALKSAVKDAPYVLYVTKQFLQNRYPTKGISAGVSDVKIEPLDADVLNQRLRKISKRQDQDKLILGTTAAVDVKYKGQQFVIAALGKLKKMGISNVEYQLVGAGDTTYLHEIAEKYDVTKQVIFKGPLPHADVFSFLDTIDAYIQPSLQEGLPRAVVEAMSRACPVLGSYTGGTPELLNKKMIFKRKNVEDIITKIKMLDKQTLLSEAKRSFEMAQEYQPEILDSRRDSFYREFLKENFLAVDENS